MCTQNECSSLRCDTQKAKGVFYGVVTDQCSIIESIAQHYLFIMSEELKFTPSLFQDEALLLSCCLTY